LENAGSNASSDASGAGAMGAAEAWSLEACIRSLPENSADIAAVRRIDDMQHLVHY
jgi:hypothetical protein